MKKYRNARDILPKELIEEIQKYVRGQPIYIPQVDRKSWGEATGSKEQYLERNNVIRRRFNGGVKVKHLADMYHLSEERIRGIIYEKLSDD